MAKNPTEPSLFESFGALAFNFFFDGWLFMLAVGVLHAEVYRIPSLGYWQSSFIAWVLAGLAATGTHSIHQRLKKLTALLPSRG